MLAMYLAGYSDTARDIGGGAFQPLNWLVPSFIPAVYVNILGAAALLLAVETSPSFHLLLSARWGAFLGKLSFPLYLIHVPVLCSLGCAAFLVLHAQLGEPAARIAAVLTTIFASMAIAYPLALINQWWITYLNKMVARIAQKDAIRELEPSSASATHFLVHTARKF
jgi:peptidoglycan/LPS O-acetylase OafA/YrhL